MADIARRRRPDRAVVAAGGGGWLRLILLPALAPAFILAYGVIFLSSGAPAMPVLYIPYALVAGPVAIAAHLLVRLNQPAAILRVVIVGATYALYFAYGIGFRRRARGGRDIGELLTVISIVHVLSALLFIYLSLGS